MPDWEPEVTEVASVNCVFPPCLSDLGALGSVILMCAPKLGPSLAWLRPQLPWHMHIPALTDCSSSSGNESPQPVWHHLAALPGHLSGDPREIFLSFISLPQQKSLLYPTLVVGGVRKSFPSLNPLYVWFVCSLWSIKYCGYFCSSPLSYTPRRPEMETFLLCYSVTKKVYCC